MPKKDVFIVIFDGNSHPQLFGDMNRDLDDTPSRVGIDDALYRAFLAGSLFDDENTDILGLLRERMARLEAIEEAAARAVEKINA